MVDEFSDAADVEQLTRAGLRILLAALLGGVLGFEREQQGKAAGVRTHMLVALGAAIFVMIMQFEEAHTDALSRVIQGIAAGVGFLCAGTILKSDDSGQIKGLTTAAGIWLTTAIGVAVGLGNETVAILATVMALIILSVLRKILERLENRHEGGGNSP
nr:MgtC/SapB family protein [Pseudomonas insulae]